MEQALLEYICNALWQVPLLAGGAWLALRVVKPGPRTQHRLWLAVLGTAVLLPMHGTGGLAVAEALPQVSIPAAAAHKQPLWWPVFPAPHTLRVRANHERWVVGIYLASVVLGSFRVARAWRTSRNLVAHSRATSRHHEALADLSRRLGVKLPQLRESAEVSSPMVVGAAAPVVLVPAGFERFTPTEISAALCHELAHIQRRDYLVNLVCQVAALPLVWHPVVDAVQQRIRMTREMVCDAMAAAEMESSIGYARCLLVLAQSMLVNRGVESQAQFLSLFGNHTLEERMMRLTETTNVPERLRAARLTGGAAIIMATFVAATMIHLTPAMAQASAPPSPQLTPPAVQAIAPVPSVTVMGAEGGKAVKRGRSAAEHRHTEERSKDQKDQAERQAANLRAIFDNPEFKKQMEEAKQQVSTVKAMLDSPEFKKQMEQATEQVSTVKAMLDSPEFKKQMEQTRQQTLRMKEVFDNPEFKRQMENVQRELENGIDLPSPKP